MGVAVTSSQVIPGQGTRRPRLEPYITLAHGSGGRAMADLITELFVRRFAGAKQPVLPVLNDQAVVGLSVFIHHGDRLALTTDSYVVDPLFFPGGDIGALAVNGTVNDLAVGGAIPLYLTCGFISDGGDADGDGRHQGGAQGQSG